MEKASGCGEPVSAAATDHIEPLPFFRFGQIVAKHREFFVYERFRWFRKPAVRANARESRDILFPTLWASNKHLFSFLRKAKS